MPGGSSATKEEPTRSGPPPSFLGATGGAKGSAGQDDQATDPTTGSQSVSPATPTVAKGARRWEKYSLLVRIFTARGRRSLEPHAWVEDLLKDFFQSILGINLSVILLSPTKCLIFCGNRAQGQGMSWNESLQYAHQLTGIHPWTGYMDRGCSLSADSQRSPTRNAGSERVHPWEDQTENHSFERLGYGASCEGPIGHAPGIAPRARHDEMGRPILHPAAAWRDEPWGVRLRTVPYPSRCSTGEPRVWTVRFRLGRCRRRRQSHQCIGRQTWCQYRQGNGHIWAPSLDALSWAALPEGTAPCVGSALVCEREFWRPKNRCLSFPLVPGIHQGGCYLLPGLVQWDWRHLGTWPRCRQGEGSNVCVLGGYGPRQLQDDRWKRGSACYPYSRWLGLLVWGVHDLSVTQCCLVPSAAEADGVRSRLLQSYGADNCHLERMPQ